MQRKKQGEVLQQLEVAKDEIVKLTSDDGTEAREEIAKQLEEAKGEIWQLTQRINAVSSGPISNASVHYCPLDYYWLM